MDPNELEFLAECELVTIVPRIRMESIDLMETQVGPFYPNIPTDVPFWVALYLRQQQKCRIVPPSWLSVARLLEFKEAEELNTGCTTPPHPHYAELATLLLQHALEDIPNHEQIRTLVKDLWDARVGKFVASANNFILSSASTARVSQLTALELATARNLLTNCLDQLAALRAARQRIMGVSDFSQSGTPISDI
ncbi:DNA replication complex GINS protein PSF2 [Taenia crassiceps]|uniref:DNA replication complex GINS protein PSF2 n=1 Tax=Taenia crassiceps TaxID=6207 RepID=A0ABR4QRB1_9CEST